LVRSTTLVPSSFASSMWPTTIVLALAAALPAPRILDATCTRGVLLRSSLLGGASALALAPRRAAADDAADSTVMRGVLQMPADVAARIPAGSTATVAIRVVGRNSKGPLATVELPLDGRPFPVDYAVMRSDMREGVADFVWQAEDIYVKADVTTSAGKILAAGRSKAKAVNVDGAPTHQTAYLTLE
jgi:hypothetical protein